VVEIGSEKWKAIEARRDAIRQVKARILRAALKLAANYASWTDDPQIIEAVKGDLGQLQVELRTICLDIKALPEQSGKEGEAAPSETTPSEGSP
jgi:hypothetical protein